MFLKCTVERLTTCTNKYIIITRQWCHYNTCFILYIYYIIMCEINILLLLLNGIVKNRRHLFMLC